MEAARSPIDALAAARGTERRAARATLRAATACLLALSTAAAATALLLALPTPAVAEPVCAPDLTASGGEPDPRVYSPAASTGVQARWCERYDARGHATRSGPYLEIGPAGTVRARAIYVESRFQGPITLYHDDGSLFLRGYLDGDAWQGALEIFHENGVTWIEATFESGRLEGPLRTRHPDGSIESETHYRGGLEHGRARSFYPEALGNPLRSEARVERGRLVGPHRVLAPDGEPIRTIEWDPATGERRPPRAEPDAGGEPGPSERADATGDAEPSERADATGDAEPSERAGGDAAPSSEGPAEAAPSIDDPELERLD